MNSWLAWGGFVVAVVFLGWVAYHFSVRTLRYVTLALVVAGVVVVTGYGVTHQAPTARAAPVNLVSAFARGMDGLSAAFCQPLLPGSVALAPGRVGWIVIVVFLAFAYRELEVWAMRWQPPTVDTSALDGGPGGPGDGGPDGQRDHDNLVAQLRFRLPAVEVRAPPLLPGGSTPIGLASIAENSGVAGSDLAGAIIRVVGLLWPRPRRYQVRVWVKPADPPAAGAGRRFGRGLGLTGQRFANGRQQGTTDRRVTVDLEDAKNGVTIATTTLASRDLDDAAARVAAYVARQIFRADQTAPPWSVGSFDGSDLAALISAKHQPELIYCPDDARRTRLSQINELDNAVRNSPGAGVARYELALLRDLQGHYAEALLLHAINRQQYPRFFRCRYRLGMSLEMIANPKFPMQPSDCAAFRQGLRILDECGLTENARKIWDYTREVSPELRRIMLIAAQRELRAGRRQLTLRRVAWATFRYRDERAVRKPYWKLRERQRPHDAARVAELLVAVRLRLNEAECERENVEFRPAQAGWLSRRRAMHIVKAISGDVTAIEAVLNSRPPAGPAQDAWHPGAKAHRTRWLPEQNRTPSWQAAYNAACLYAALTCDGKKSGGANDDRMAKLALRCLRRTVNDRDCEMERPWDWISIDPDLRCLRDSQRFRDFLVEQMRKDYPRAAR